MRKLVIVSTVLAVLGTRPTARAEEPGPAPEKEWTVPGLGMEFIWIPAMACWVGKYEVANAEYRAFRPKHNSKAYRGHTLNDDRQPAVQLHFGDAQAFAVWLTERERKAGRLPKAFRYRLPTGDEWMTFAQCGDGRRFPWGRGRRPRHGNYAEQSAKDAFPESSAVTYYDDGFAVSSPVEASGRSDWGLYGVGGNVWEWTSKLKNDTIVFDDLRGACWDVPDWMSQLCNARCGTRSKTTRGNFFGFRLVLATFGDGLAALRQEAEEEAAAKKRRTELEQKIQTQIAALLEQSRATPGGLRGPTPGKEWTVPEVGMEFVWIPALTGWAGKHEVTNAEYRALKPEHDSGSYGAHTLDGDNQPVVSVNFDDARAYAEWLTEREGKAERLPEGFRYRVPTGEEWMALAQCGDGREFPWGDDWPPARGNYAGVATRDALPEAVTISGYDNAFAVTCPVEESGQNSWGLRGIGGNVWEWTGKVGGTEVVFDTLRGASWDNADRTVLRCEYRGVSVPSLRSYGIGFRLIVSPR